MVVVGPEMKLKKRKEYYTEPRTQAMYTMPVLVYYGVYILKKLCPSAYQKSTLGP